MITLSGRAYALCLITIWLAMEGLKMKRALRENIRSLDCMMPRVCVSLTALVEPGYVARKRTMVFALLNRVCYCCRAEGDETERGNRLLSSFGLVCDGESEMLLKSCSRDSEISARSTKVGSPVSR